MNTHAQIHLPTTMLVGIPLLCLVLSCVALGQSYVLEYDEDFSSDPGWTTNDPSNLYWDGASGTYHAWQANTNTSYAYKQIDWNGQSFLMEWDVRINSVEWSAGSTFGLFDPQLLYAHNSIVGDFSLVDNGYGITLDAQNGSDRAHDTWFGGWQTGIWYRNSLSYNADTGYLTMDTIQLDNGQIVSNLNASIVGYFPSDIDLIGVSRLHMEGYNNNAINYNLDNVKFYEVPTPSSASILIASFAIMTGRRRRC